MLVRGVLSLALVLVSACSSSDSEAPPIIASPLSPATEAWWTYEREATFDVVATEVDVPMRDAVTIGCALYRPASGGEAAAGTFPGLVVEFTPYVVLQAAYGAEASFFVRRGYVALVCTLRGTGRSAGTWQHAMSSQDGRDAHDLVEWLAAQTFCDGRVGQLGESYGGATSYGAAVERAPHLRAVAPMQPPSNLYEDVVYPGGIKSTERGSIDNWPPVAQGLSEGAIDAEAEYAENRAHPTFDEYWQDRSLLGRLRDIEVPVLTIGGWRDEYFRSGTLAGIEGALDRTWAIYGPWTHFPPVTFQECDDPCASELLPSGVLLAWFDRWVMELAGVPVPDTPSFVSFEGPEGRGAGWRELSHWDPEGREAATWELGSESFPADGGALTFREPAEPTADRGAIRFTSDPLERDRVLLGHPTLELRATSSGEDASFYVELIDVAPDDAELVVNDGFLRASRRDSHEHPTPVEPGAPTDYRIGIRPQHYRFAAGHRVRLRLSGGPSHALVPADPPVDVTVLLDPKGFLRLPGFAADRGQGAASARLP